MKVSLSRSLLIISLAFVAGIAIGYLVVNKPSVEKPAASEGASAKPSVDKLDVKDVAIEEPASPEITANPSLKESPAALRLLAWNLESGNSDPKINAAQLKEFADVDLFGLSEVDPAAFEIYLEAIESIDDRNFASVKGKTGDKDRLQFVYCTDRFELLEEKEPNELAGIVVNTGGHRSPLICLLKDKRTGQRFYTMLVHQARGNENFRNQQASAIREWARDQSIAFVAMGDFNYDFSFESQRGNQSFDELRKDNVLQWVRPEELIESNWTDLNHDLVNDYPNSLLDGFFVAGPAKEWQVVSRVIVRPGDFPDDESRSDHRPVELVIEYR